MLHLAVRAAEVVHVEHEGAHHLFHHEVIQLDSLHRAAAPAPGFEADAAVCLVEHAGGHHDVADAAGHFAAQHHAAVPMQEVAVADDDALAHLPIRRILRAGLDGNAIVADINRAVVDAHILTAVGVDAVGVGGIRRIFDIQPANDHIPAIERMHRPRRGVGERHVLQRHMLAVVEAHEVGSRMCILPCPLARPPVAALSIQRAIAGDGHVLGVFGVDARLMRQSCDALELQVNQREGGCVLMEAQHRAGLDVQRHVIVQADCARGVVARGDNQRAATTGAEVSNGLLEGSCPVGGGGDAGSVVENVHWFSSGFC